MYIVYQASQTFNFIKNYIITIMIDYDVPALNKCVTYIE